MHAFLCYTNKGSNMPQEPGREGREKILQSTIASNWNLVKNIYRHGPPFTPDTLKRIDSLQKRLTVEVVTEITNTGTSLSFGQLLETRKKLKSSKDQKPEDAAEFEKVEQNLILAFGKVSGFPVVIEAWNQKHPEPVSADSRRRKVDVATVEMQETGNVVKHVMEILAPSIPEEIKHELTAYATLSHRLWVIRAMFQNGAEAVVMQRQMTNEVGDEITLSVRVDERESAAWTDYLLDMRIRLQKTGLTTQLQSIDAELEQIHGIILSEGQLKRMLGKIDFSPLDNLPYGPLI